MTLQHVAFTPPVFPSDVAAATDALNELGLEDRRTAHGAGAPSQPASGEVPGDAAPPHVPPRVAPTVRAGYRYCSQRVAVIQAVSHTSTPCCSRCRRVRAARSTTRHRPLPPRLLVPLPEVPLQPLTFHGVQVEVGA